MQKWEQKKGITFVIPSRATRIRTLKMTESESVALPFGDGALSSVHNRGHLDIIHYNLRYCKYFFYFSSQGFRRQTIGTEQRL